MNGDCGYWSLRFPSGIPCLTVDEVTEGVRTLQAAADPLMPWAFWIGGLALVGLFVAFVIEANVARKRWP